MTTKDLLSRISGNVKIARDYEISSLCYDSRDCILHSAFFCFKGTRTDGNLFIRKAIQNGARCIITDQEIREELPDDVSYAVTRENTRRCYAIASGAFFQNPARSMKVIGVTGTDGKSSTSFFIYQLLLALGHRCGLSSTVSVDNGSGLRNAPWRQSTPEAFLLHSFLKQAKDNRCEYMVIEATSHALSTEYDRLAGIHFDTSCITRISSEHLDFHRTLKNYVSSKLRLFRNTKNSAFVYENNEQIAQIRKSFGDWPHYLTLPEVVETSSSGLVFNYNGRNYTLPFFHTYMLENAFEAAAVVSSVLSCPLEDILPLLASLKGVEGRDEIVPNTIGRNLVIDFAHTPDSVSRLLSDYRRIFPEGNFITLFGAAGKRDTSKRAGLGLEAARFSSVLVITEEDNRDEPFEKISNDILSGIPESEKEQLDILLVPVREDAIRKAIEVSRPGDTVFFLGKGHEHSIEAKKERKYSERRALEKVLRTLSR